MPALAIHAVGLSKRYELGQRERYGSLRDTITDGLRTVLRPFGRRPAEKAERTLWALKDVSLDVEKGRVVGIVGRNGAGKSTLLKVLSRVTEPTAGSAQLWGRVGSLLEVGTGFHPELTGRENIFLNAAILGMKRADAVRRFDAIVEFAEIARFIDTPVKRYSSGMQARLAFSVAAHLDPDILLVDEVLAVGDRAFQQKCLGKMGDVSQHGRTVILVSHQMNQIRRLCDQVAWLDQGELVALGPAGDVLTRYERSTMGSGERPDRDQGAAARWLHWGIDDAEAGCEHTVDTFGEVAVSFTLEVRRPLCRARHGIALLKDGTQNLWGTAYVDLDLEPGVHRFTHTLPLIPFQPGVYAWQVSLYSSEGMIDLWDCLPEMSIITPPVTHYRDEYAGLLNLRTGFSTRLQRQPVGAAG